MGQALCDVLPARFRDVDLPEFQGRVDSVATLEQLALAVLRAVDTRVTPVVLLELCAVEVPGVASWHTEAGPVLQRNDVDAVAATLHAVCVWRIQEREGTAHHSVAGALLPSGSGEGAGLPWAFAVPTGPHQELCALANTSFVMSPRTTALLRFAHAVRDHLAWQIAGIFEMHVTVSGGAGVERFRQLCEELKCKTVLIELNAAKAGAHLSNQLMTASHHRGDSLYDLQERCFGMARRFVAEGFAIDRVKVEAMMSDEGVPDADADAAQRKSNYFEFHVKLALDTADHEQYRRLAQLCADHSAHLSKNALKKMPDGREHRFVTLRLYRVGRVSAVDRLERCVAALQAGGFSIVSTQREYSCYDSNVQLDQGWIDKSRGD